VLTVAAWLGCARDPARDRPIEPWASPNAAPVTDVGTPLDGGVPPGSTGP
jgi:hypothetical protein